MFKRLLLLLLCAFGLSLSVLASETKISGLRINGGIDIASVDEACITYGFTSYFTRYGAAYSGSWSWLDGNSGSNSIAVCHGTGGTLWGATLDLNVHFVCDKGGTFSREKLGCYGEGSEPQSCPAAGTNYLELMDGEDVPVGTKGLFCLDSCQMKAPGTVACVEVSGRWSCWAGGPGWITYTGSECTGNEGEMPTTGNDPLPTDCKAGTCPGTINGNAVCVPCDSSIGDGSGSTGGGSGSGDGGTGSGTGTGSGEGGGSGTGGTGTGTGGGGNGDDSGGSDWGGDCKIGFTCEGDALVCAISKAAHIMNCGLLEDPKQTDEYKLVDEARQNADDINQVGGIAGKLPSASINIKDYFDSTSATGTGKCMADRYFTWHGKQFTIPFSEWCDLFRWIGFIVQAIALMWGLRIAFGGGV